MNIEKDTFILYRHPLEMKENMPSINMEILQVKEIFPDRGVFLAKKDKLLDVCRIRYIFRANILEEKILNPLYNEARLSAEDAAGFKYPSS